MSRSIASAENELDNDFSCAPLLLEHDESAWLSGFTSFQGPRWREFHCLAAPTLHTTRRAVLPFRVVPLPGCSAEVDTCINFLPLACSRPDFLKSVNSFGPTVFFYKFSRFFLSIRVVKSQNEFETKAVTLNHAWCHTTRKIGKFQKIDELIKLVARAASKINNFPRWCDLKALQCSRAFLL